MKWLLLLLGSITLTLTGCQEYFADSSSNETQSQEENAKSDWPSYPIKKLTKKSDSIVYAEVTDIEKKQGSGEPDYQLATIKVKKSFKGDNKKITLKQSQNFVEKGAEYILFLIENGDYFYQTDGSSILKKEDGKFRSHINGFNGEYTLSEFESKIKPHH